MYIEWPTLKAKVRANLLEDKAPRVCSAFKKILPFQSIQEHTMISGEGLYCAAPLRITFMDYMVSRKQGDIYFFNPGQLVVIVYGQTTEPLKVNKFAEVRRDDLAILSQVGKAVWANTLKPILPTSGDDGRQIIPVVFSE